MSYRVWRLVHSMMSRMKSESLLKWPSWTVHRKRTNRTPSRNPFHPAAIRDSSIRISGAMVWTTFRSNSITLNPLAVKD